MARLIRVQRGGVVPVRFEFREQRRDNLTGRLTAPNGCTLQFLNPDGSSIGAAQSCTFVGRGEFAFFWDTALLAAGDYRAKLRYGYAYSTAQGGVTKVGERDVILRLVTAL